MFEHVGLAESPTLVFKALYPALFCLVGRVKRVVNNSVNGWEPFDILFFIAARAAPFSALIAAVMVDCQDGSQDHGGQEDYDDKMNPETDCRNYGLRIHIRCAVFCFEIFVLCVGALKAQLILP